MKAFGLKPDLVSGVATNTEAEVQLIEKLSGVRALNIMDLETHGEILDIIDKSIGGCPVSSKFNLECQKDH
ncbi:MAG: hypothetical protein AAFX87_20210 [Bacteroidota bacterium]